MPPLCAPSPPCLLSEMPSETPPPLPQEEETENSQIVASLVAALTDAEASAAAESNANNSHMLASQAYTSLCFDYPVVSTNALAALASAFRSRSLGSGTSMFPITEKFTSGLRYLVSIESAKQSGQNAQAAVENILAASGHESSDVPQLRLSHLAELCGCVFLLAPALKLATVHKDDGASLQDYFVEYVPSYCEAEEIFPRDNVAVSNFEPDEDGLEISELQEIQASAAVYDEGETEIDDDDSDWEALETFAPATETIRFEATTSPGQIERATWSVLIDKVAHLTGAVPTEITKTSVWAELQLTDHLIKALKSIGILQRKEANVDVSSVVKLYAELLSEHLLFEWRTSSSEVPQVISALINLGGTSGDIKCWNTSYTVGIAPAANGSEVALSALSRLCSQAGGYPRTTSPTICTASFGQLAAGESNKQFSLPGPAFVRCLWQTVYSNVHFLQAQLMETLQRPESFQLEMVLWILCFMVKYAPGNVDLRVTLLEGGIFRTALQLFVKVGEKAEMESLRHFLLLSMASSTALSEFASQVPSFIASVSATELEERTAARAHFVIWPFVLRAGCGQSSSTRKQAGHQPDRFKTKEAEASLVTAMDGTVTAMADDSMKTNPHNLLKQLLWVQRLLFLMEEATSTASGSTFEFWQRSGPLERSMGRLQSFLGSLLVHVAEAPTPVSSPRQKAHEKNFEDDDDSRKIADGNVGVSTPRAAQITSPKEPIMGHSVAYDAEVMALQEKLKEMLPGMLLQLKLLSALTRGNQEAKID